MKDYDSWKLATPPELGEPDHECEECGERLDALTCSACRRECRECGGYLQSDSLSEWHCSLECEQAEADKLGRRADREASS